MSISSIPTVRLASLDELIQTVIPQFISPVPSRDTLRGWFDAAKVPRLKSNPSAKRGGGTTYYSVAGVEKFFRSRVLTGRLIPADRAKGAA
jgi:hypothetical protein